jgi:Domain of unknown function (DUF1902)
MITCDMEKITVNAEWHDAEGVWIATSDDIWGLAAQAPDLEKLKKKVLPMIADLIELNKVEIVGPSVPIHFVAHSTNILSLEDVA